MERVFWGGGLPIETDAIILGGGVIIPDCVENMVKMYSIKGSNIYIYIYTSYLHKSERD